MAGEMAQWLKSIYHSSRGPEVNSHTQGSQLPVILQRICPPQTLVLMCTHTLYTIHIIKIRNTSFIKKKPKNLHKLSLREAITV